MKKTSILLSILLALSFFKCKETSSTEITQSVRNNIVDVQDRISQLDIPDLLVSSSNYIYMTNKYYFITDDNSYENYVYLFDKRSNKLLKSFLTKGDAPYQLQNPGFVGYNPSLNEIYVADYAKLKVYGYDVDSLLSDSLSKPFVKTQLNEMAIPDSYYYINDSTFYCRIMKPIGTSNYNPVGAKYNLASNKVEKYMLYKNPYIKKRRLYMTFSKEKNIYVEAYSRHDLITICDLQGNLKYNIYGPKWSPKEGSRKSYFFNCVVCKDKLIVGYSGKDALERRSDGSLRTKLPTQLMMFNLKGEYLKTLNLGVRFFSIVYNDFDNSLYLSLDEADYQFARLDLNGLI